jgi:hypothetical protein
LPDGRPQIGGGTDAGYAFRVDRRAAGGTPILASKFVYINICYSKLWNLHHFGANLVLLICRSNIEDFISDSLVNILASDMRLSLIPTQDMGSNIKMITYFAITVYRGL